MHYKNSLKDDEELFNRWLIAKIDQVLKYPMLLPYEITLNNLTSKPFKLSILGEDQIFINGYRLQESNNIDFLGDSF